MRAAIYNPYLDSLGGGERYTMTFAKVLAGVGWEVDVEWVDKDIIERLTNRLGLDLKNINIVKSVNNGKGYDLIFWLSDGSIPRLKAKKNIIHFQTPFANVGGKSLLNKIKLHKVNIVCNSAFTKKVIDKEYGINSQVIYPPVDIESFKAEKKEKIIIFVGRFSALQQQKGQDILIEAFRNLSKKVKGWKLILIGGSDVGSTELINTLQLKAKGLNVEILENLPFAEIKKYYARSKIFWSASGYGIDEKLNPKKVEHFGITVVEAMAAGCVPIVVSKGGHKEIINKGGYLWVSLSQLEKITLDLIKNERRILKIAHEAQYRAKEFSEENFVKNILNLVE